MALSKNIAAFRGKRGWTLEHLASLANMEVVTISALENRDSRMSKYTGRIAAAFGVSIEQLINGDDRPGEAPAVVIQPHPLKSESKEKRASHVRAAVLEMLKATDLEGELELRESGAADGYPEDVVKQAMRELWQESADHLKVHSADYIADALAKKLLTWINNQARSKKSRRKPCCVSLSTDSQSLTAWYSGGARSPKAHHAMLN